MSDSKDHSNKDDFFDWAYDTRYYQKRSVLLAWGTAAFFAILATLAIIAVVGLTPLKENTPFVFAVDKNTGIIEPRTTTDVLNWTADAAEDYANVAGYITLREAYLKDTYASNYEEAVRKSSGIARAALVRDHAPDGPKSPIIEWGERAQLNVRFKSVNHHGSNKNIVIARFIVDTVYSDKTDSEHYVATVEYVYADGEELSLMTRLSNPHAFVVTNYQVSKEGFQDE
jgi:type IV secretion system protein VirB8